MRHLIDISVDDLQRALDSVERKTPALRLVAAIAYKNGVTQSELAEWLDVERKTVYNWLTRLEERELETAIHDEPRAGRPRKLTEGQLEELRDVLQKPPTEVGFEAAAWTTDILQLFIREAFETDYSRSSCRRLMKEAGLRYQPARQAATETDQKEPAELEQEQQELGHIWVPE